MKSKGGSAAVLMITLLVATLAPTFLPKAAAMPVVTSLEPTSGPVGTPVRVIGEIDTPGGAFQILWDGKIVKNDSSTAGSTRVNTTFRVPPSTQGEHNVTLRDVTSGNLTTPVPFTVTTAYRLLPKPKWVQEGFNTNLTLSVTGGSGNTRYRFAISVTDPTSQGYVTNLSVATNSSGSGQGTIRYYADFPGAHTNYLGPYQVTANQTLVSTVFTVGLTDAAEYKRLETVHIRGSGYLPNEGVWINVTFGGKNITSEKKLAVNGVVETRWKIPANASLGIYNVALKSASVPGTNKPLANTQNFTVVEFHGRVQTQNLDGEPVADVTVEVSDAATLKVLDWQKTNGTGWAKFLLKTGNYTFTALWKNDRVEVGRLTDQAVTGNASLILGCKLAQLRISVKDRAGAPISFVNVTLAYNYTMRNGQKTLGVEYFETDPRGLAVVNNTLADVKYRIEARRYERLFNETLIERLTASRWVNITCPTYTLLVHVLDSKQLPTPNLQVRVYEWTVYDRPIKSQVTNETGYAIFNLTLGRYKVIALSFSQKLGWVPLNETILDLFENWTLPFHCQLLNLDLSVAVVDFFGSPFPNVMVKVEREVEGEWREVESKTTGSNGRVTLPLIGGDYSISIYLGESLLGVKTLRLDTPKEIVFKVDKYVVIGGNPMETSQFITLISIGSVILLVVLALKYQKIWQVVSKEKAEKAK